VSAPSFFIVGAPKAGTTSMAAYLRQHPSLFLPDEKDVPFFGSDLDYRRPRRSLADYLALFDGAAEGEIAGDACVSYLQSRLGAQEIHSFDPEARIVVMLREPVVAMHSMHSFMRSAHNEDIADFEGALNAEADRIEGRRIPPGARIADELLYRRVYSYAEQVERYLKRFGRERVEVVLLDDLEREPAPVVARTFAFLGVDPGFEPELKVHHVARTIRSDRLQKLAAGPPPRLLKAYNLLAPRAMHGKLIPLLNRFNVRPGDARKRPAAKTSLGDEALRREMWPGVERLAAVIDRDLSAWAPADAELAEDRHHSLAHGVR
jgi:hypothetical protein